MTTDLQSAAEALVVAGQLLAGKGWAPATSGNYSARIDQSQVAITVSGRDKGQLVVDDIMRVDLEGRPITTDKKASAETLLHTSLYRHYASIGAVLHTHSIDCVTLSRWLLKQGKQDLWLTDYELMKALPGIDTHGAELSIPIVPNSQEMVSLGKEVLDRLNQLSHPVGYIIAGHGLYAWGATVRQALMATEALEVLVSCTLKELYLEQGRP